MKGTPIIFVCGIAATIRTSPKGRRAKQLITTHILKRAPARAGYTLWTPHITTEKHLGTSAMSITLKLKSVILLDP